MPSPLAHSTMGYVIYRMAKDRSSGQGLGKVGPLPNLLILTVGLSLLPDIDSIAGVALGDFGRYHNGPTHSLFVGLAVALLVAGVAQWTRRSGFFYWFAIASLCYQSHVIFDFFTVGRGVLLFWPLTSARFQSPVRLFYGLRWSDGFTSIHHVWTLLSELGFALLLVAAVHLLERKRASTQSERSCEDCSTQIVPEEGR
jgi:membrane-bound metal-dependent hydrolase YbcI (DUF457 family)